jgi:hypothetical protein
MDTQTDVEDLGLTICKSEKNCDACGSIIRAGDWYYIRYSPTMAIYCADCRTINVGKWRKNKKNYDCIVSEIIDVLDTHGFVETQKIVNNYSLSKEQLRRILKKVNDKGYILDVNGFDEGFDAPKGHGLWNLLYSPIITEFFEALQSINSESEITMYSIEEKYHSSFSVISKLIYRLLGIGSENNDSYYTMHSYILFLMNNIDIDDCLNELYLGRIGFDDEVYNEITRDNRNLVMSYLIESIFSLSNKVVLGEYGNFVIDGENKSFSIITDESMLNVDSSYDMDIFIAGEDIICFVSDNGLSEEPYDLLEYLDLQSNEEANIIFKMATKLIKEGF